jgi:hypothetical protein
VLVVRVRISIVVALALLLGACATDPVLQAERDQAAVAKRAQERWDLLIDGRLESAYQYLATGYRQITPFPHYRKTVKGIGVWKSAQVQNVNCKEDLCKADINVKMELNYPLMRGPVRTENVITEQWVKDQKGIWGFLPTVQK